MRSYRTNAIPFCPFFGLLILAPWCVPLLRVPLSHVIAQSGRNRSALNKFTRHAALTTSILVVKIDVVATSGSRSRVPVLQEVCKLMARIDLRLTGQSAVAASPRPALRGHPTPCTTPLLRRVSDMEALVGGPLHLPSRASHSSFTDWLTALVAQGYQQVDYDKLPDPNRAEDCPEEADEQSRLDDKGGNERTVFTITIGALEVKVISGAKATGTGWRVWPASRLLAECIFANSALLTRSTRTIELGAGCGLVGCTAGKISPNEILISDYKDAIVARITRAIELNGLVSGAHSLSQQYLTSSRSHYCCSGRLDQHTCPVCAQLHDDPGFRPYLLTRSRRYARRRYPHTVCTWRYLSRLLLALPRRLRRVRGQHSPCVSEVRVSTPAPRLARATSLPLQSLDICTRRVASERVALSAMIGN